MKREVEEPKPSWWPALTLGVLSFADGACTLSELRNGFAEANPAAAWLIRLSPAWFLYLKTWPLLALAIVVTLHGRPRARQALKVCAWVYIVLVAYHAWILTGGSPLLVAE